MLQFLESASNAGNAGAAQSGGMLGTIIMMLGLLGVFYFLMVTQSGLWDLSSPTRDLTWDTAVKCRVLITGPPGNSLQFCYFFFKD